MRKLNEIIIHCTATPQSRDLCIDTIRKWHRGRGWNDIGYHYVISLDGTIKNARPLSKTGAHVKGRNTATIGICYIGGVSADGKTPKDTRTPAQKASLIKLIKQLISDYPSIKKISGHNQYAAKACPSFNAGSEYKYLTGFSTSALAQMPDMQTKYRQKLLALAGYYSGQYDGIYGPETKAGLKEFQDFHGLTKSGQFDVETVAKLRLFEIPVPVRRIEKAVIDDAAANGRKSGTEIAALATTASGMVYAVKETLDAVKNTTMTLINFGPWILLGAAVAVFGIYIFIERKRKKKQARAAL